MLQSNGVESDCCISGALRGASQRGVRHVLFKLSFSSLHLIFSGAITRPIGHFISGPYDRDVADHAFYAALAVCNGLVRCDKVSK